MLILPDVAKAIKMATAVKILNQKTQNMTYFNLTEEQIRMLEALVEHKSVMILKGRQISASTLFCYVDFLVALLNPGAKVAICCDNQTKANDLLAKCRSFANQLNITLSTDHTKRIVFAHNGAEIHAVSTVGGGAENEESRVGRSQSYQFIHMSELPYWTSQKSYGALLACSSGAPVVIESTAKTSGDLFHKLWTTNNEYHKLFFSVNDHKYYKSYQGSIKEADWLELQELGCTTKETAIWWLNTLHRNGGNKQQMLRDYPFLPDQPFVNNASRHISIDPVVRPHTPRGMTKVFTPPGGRCIMTVDPASGGGGDNAVITVMSSDKPGDVWATWVNNTTAMSSQLTIISDLYNYYKPSVVIVEKNGIGNAWVELLTERGVPVLKINTDAASKQLGLDLAKSYIEDGTLACGDELVWEAQHFYYNKRGIASGPKDLLMALGFGLIYLQDHKTTPPVYRSQDVYIPPTIEEENNWF